VTRSVAELAIEPTAVYRLYDAREELIYVGMTVNPDMRFGSHAVTKPWWPEVARRDIAWFETRHEAEQREAQLIAHYHPRYNTIGTPQHALECGERSREAAARLALQLAAEGPASDPTADLLAALALPSRGDQAKALGEVLNRIPSFANYVKELRRDVVKAMHTDDDMSWAEIGEAIGQHRTRAAQIARGVPGGDKKRKPEQQDTPPAG
jgi:hypothetical protein